MVVEHCPLALSSFSFSAFASLEQAVAVVLQAPFSSFFSSTEFDMVRFLIFYYLAREYTALFAGQSLGTTAGAE
ncbi:MAG: hypothetical protein HC888_14820 [Candidatus Competibacteraceae bacterium]|nr:hypothetical protein [Candidatus Competibacteraceae bacterium]